MGVVRISNRYCYTQIAWATLKGDRILCQATSQELQKYGLPGDFGLKNWTACYATGLLLARRVLKKLGLDELYEGQTELDGGLAIPHSVRRFPCGEKEGHDAELLRKYIFGGHVGEYMEQMEEDDEELYKTHFARYLEADVTNDNMEDTWQAVYDKIREDPEYKKSERKAPAKKLKRKAKLSASQRQNRVNQKIASFAAKQDA